jgi:hypothetical protein
MEPTTTPQEHLVRNIKTLIEVNKELIGLKAQVKDLNVQKKGITEELIRVMKERNIDCFDVNDGVLLYKTKRTKKSLNAKTLLEAMKDYCETSDKIDESIVDELVKHVLESQEVVIKDDLQCKLKV